MIRSFFLIAIACAPIASGSEAEPVDLSRQEYESISVDRNEAAVGSNEHVLSAPWWQNFELSGFGAVGFYDTGRDATRPHGGFEIKEASLFIHADVWEKIGMFVELQTNRLGKDDQLFTRTGEVYVHFRDLIDTPTLRTGLKVGRIDIPFGEEYLWQDAIDNPLITNSAAYVYGWDEGVLAYGEYKGLSFVASITDGTDARSQEDHDDKALNLKLSGNPTKKLYLSFSAMRNGPAAKSAIEFGGSHFQPVGASHTSTLGNSSSLFVNGSLLQMDAKYQLSNRSYISTHVGFAHQSDDDAEFERDFQWFGVEHFKRLSRDWYLVTRYSEIGTFDDDEGYHFDGKPFADGNGAFGYDIERLRRLAVGLSYAPNPRVRVKMELGKDWFELIDISPLTGTDKRDFAAVEVVVGF